MENTELQQLKQEILTGLRKQLEIASKIDNVVDLLLKDENLSKNKDLMKNLATLASAASRIRLNACQSRKGL